MLFRSVRSNMKVTTIVDAETGQRRDVTEYPLVALREVLLNALVHRDYSIHTEGKPIQLTMYSDRVEVASPGGLYGRLRVDQLGHTQPDTRNPVLATAMEVLGLTENRYSGIPTVRKQMEAAGLPEPEFIDTQSSFKVTLRKAADGAKAAREIKREAKNQRALCETVAEEDLLAFCSVPRTREELADTLGLGSKSYAISRYVMPLVKKGKLQMTDPDHPKSKNQRFVRISSRE